ncbi:MAG: ABC transporter ATP-binding protein [Planctomycetota bacterium]|nr:MAG: ABC transporter ATP-binding protein [Planctomycetota bacterium]
MIEVARLYRRFGAHVAVDDVSFRIDKGEVVGFLGPNGAGKTTTMRVLTGFLPATSADVLRVAGYDVLRESLEVRRHIGYLPESVPLYHELRVSEMMRFQGRLHGIPRAELKRRIPEVLERVGVLDRERQLVGKLSRGLRQRVGLAVALLPDPDVLILDEPTSGLDPLQRVEVRELIRSFAAEHTVLMSSHILAEVESVCPRVIVIAEGRIVADGSQADLVREFGGEGYVRFEAVVGPDVAAAVRLLEGLPGVTRVDERGRVGIHHSFEIRGAGDLREDVGAVAMTKGWAVRELSLAVPTLDEMFARLVLGGDGAAAPASATGVPPATAASPVAQGLELATGAAQPGAAPPPGTPGKKIIYSLNPFDQGASRDLGQPMDVGGPAPPEDEDR